MNDIFNLIYSHTSATSTGVTLLAFMIIYTTLERKVKALPKIPFNFFILYITLRIITNNLDFLGVEGWKKWIAIAAMASLYCGVVRILFYAIVETFFKWRRKKKMPRITKDFILFAIYALIVIVLLRTMGGVNLAGLITTSAILTAAIGLGAQKTLGNLFAGIMIQMDKPYEIGDWIEFNSFIGEVIHISWEITRIRTRKNEIVCIPNQHIASSIIKNLSPAKDSYLSVFEIGINYSTPPDLFKKVVMDVLTKDSKVLTNPAPLILLKEFADFAIIYTVRLTISNYRDENIILGDIRRKLWYALKRHDIEIPFPIRTVRYSHIEHKIANEAKEEIKKSARAVLRKIPLFFPISDGQIDEMSEKIDLIEFGEGEIIVKQADPGSSMFVIENGNVDVLLELENGNERSLATLNEGSFFGEMSLLTGEPRSATVKANVQTQLLEIKKDAFTTIFASDPSISGSLADLLAKRQAEISKTKESEEELSNKRNQLLSKIKNFFGMN